MILAVLCRDYTQFRRFVSAHFPRQSRGLLRDILCLDSRDDILKFAEIERGQLFIDIGAEDQALRDWCVAREFLEIEIKGGM